MLPRKHRIPRTLFPNLLSSRQFAHSPHFSLRFDLGGKTAQIAVSVSKKISKSAVVRNTVRRRASAILQKHLEIFPSGLYLFVAKSRVQMLKGKVLEDELTTLLKSLKKG